MANVFPAVTCPHPFDPLVVQDVELPELNEDDVEVRVQYCGICASDVGACGDHAVMYTFPLVPGHEGVGEVIRVGSKAGNLRVGDKVGLGVYRSSCSTCEYCSKGWDNVCTSRVLIFRGGNAGAFSSHVRINYRYAFKIPEGIPLSHAGPLMCAGTTVFAPFIEHGITPSSRIGVVGIGGLGHLALQFANKWGCTVTAFSTSPTKETEARDFGAHHFVVTSRPEEVAFAVGTIDYLLMTAGGGSGIHWDQLFSFLAPRGKIVLIGFTGREPIPCPPLSLIMGEKGIVGSAAGSRNVTIQMLKFSAAHGVQPAIELFPARAVNEAFKKIQENTIRYRAVLQISDLYETQTSNDTPATSDS